MLIRGEPLVQFEDKSSRTSKEEELDKDQMNNQHKLKKNGKNKGQNRLQSIVKKQMI